MAHLTLAGLSEDGKRLLLVDDRGAEFTVDVDQALRSALRGEHARLGQLEIHMDGTLRPRDIQARIRSGESPEAVAQAASTTVEQVMPYAAPVLAERAHIADRAQRASLRRTAGEGGARNLGDAVIAHLTPLNVSSETVDWDAWKREDGRWTLSAAFSAPKRSGTGTFTFDVPGNYVTAENDDARWLVGDAPERKPKSAADRPARARRLSSVPAEQELPLGEDALEMVHEEEDHSPAADSEPESSGLEDSPFLARAFERQNQPEAQSEEEPAQDEPAEVDGAAAVDDESVHATQQPEPEPEPEPVEEATEPEPAKKPARKRGRASVPSWDEIMFGGGKD